jgi:predicted phosphodiesterase
MTHEDYLFLNGDILDATVHWRECWEAFLGVVNFWPPKNIVWIRGNNDHFVNGKHYRLPELVHCGMRSHVLCHTGVNIAVTPWAGVHTLATQDDEDKMWAELTIAAGEGTYPSILMTHFPLINRYFGGLNWDSKKNKYSEFGWTEEPFAAQELRAFLGLVPSINTLVFGHVHHEEYDAPFPHNGLWSTLDCVPPSLTTEDGRELPVHLVSDHRKQMFHKVWES